MRAGSLDTATCMWARCSPTIRTATRSITATAIPKPLPLEARKTAQGLVVLAFYSGAVAGHAHILNSASQTELSFPDPGETPYSFTEHDAALRQQSFVIPPTQPPQV